MELLKEAEVWVGVGLILFFAILVVARVPGKAGAALDAKSGQIRTALEEAQRLRAEAQAVLDDLKAKRAQMERDAERMVADALVTAARLEADAKVKLEELMDRRAALAERRIAAAEREAKAEVKAAAAELAANTAQTVLMRRLKGLKSDPLADKAIAGLAERLG